MPDEIIDRAQVILDAFEQHDTIQPTTEGKPEPTTQTANDDTQPLREQEAQRETQSEALHEEKAETYPTQTSSESTAHAQQFEQAAFDLFNEPPEQSEVERQIKDLNLSNMTPIEALVKLNDLQNQLK